MKSLIKIYYIRPIFVYACYAIIFSTELEMMCVVLIILRIQKCLNFQSSVVFGEPCSATLEEGRGGGDKKFPFKNYVNKYKQ